MDIDTYMAISDEAFELSPISKGRSISGPVCAYYVNLTVERSDWAQFKRIIDRKYEPKPKSKFSQFDE